MAGEKSSEAMKARHVADGVLYFIGLMAIPKIQSAQPLAVRSNRDHGSKLTERQALVC
jgi:hypothetical protein